MHSPAGQPHERRRFSGVLLHPTSLPGLYGVGDFGDEATAFLDWAANAGMRLWQVLPLNPPGYGPSPYGCLSTFAGNPILVSPQRLMQDGLLDASDVGEVPRFAIERVDWDLVVPYKMSLLRIAWERFESERGDALRPRFEEFVAEEEAHGWLHDYALYMAVKEHHGGAPWWAWPDPIKLRDGATLAALAREHGAAVRFWKFAQFIFYRQWGMVRDAARARGIRIVGDVPIYVAADSADVWSNRDLFLLDEESGAPTAVAGVPPDYFSATGQRWGNPLYRWDVLQQTGYHWWIERIRMNLRMADIVRLDHFRGFSAYWEVPATEETAVNGRWMQGPGLALFEALRERLGELPLIAEDLGFITEDVHDLRKAIGIPGMKILQFGFAEADSTHLPHRYDCETVAYTGTHDNDTARGWFESASAKEKEHALAYLGCREADKVPMALVRAVYTSVADICIIPVQDVLGLGTDARMNIPGEDNPLNWSWRLQLDQLTWETAEPLHELAVLTGRA